MTKGKAGEVEKLKNRETPSDPEPVPKNMSRRYDLRQTCAAPQLHLLPRNELVAAPTWHMFSVAGLGAAAIRVYWRWHRGVLPP